MKGKNGGKMQKKKTNERTNEKKATSRKKGTTFDAFPSDASFLHALPPRLFPLFRRPPRASSAAASPS